MAHVPQTQALYSQDTTQTQGTPQTQAMPQMQGQTGFTIPVHWGLLTLISDLNKLHIDIKPAARDVATVAGVSEATFNRSVYLYKHLHTVLSVALAHACFCRMITFYLYIYIYIYIYIIVSHCRLLSC